MPYLNCYLPCHYRTGQLLGWDLLASVHACISCLSFSNPTPSLSGQQHARPYPSLPCVTATLQLHIPQHGCHCGALLLGSSPTSLLSLSPKQWHVLSLSSFVGRGQTGAFSDLESIFCSFILFLLLCLSMKAWLVAEKAWRGWAMEKTWAGRDGRR